MKEYTMVDAAKILGMSKSSLHSVRQVGKIRAKKKLVKGVPTLFVDEPELRRYARKKAGKLKEQLSKMDKKFIRDLP